MPFATPDELRAWLEAHHDTADELHLLLFKRASGRPSVTWAQLVDELLCFGWIDGHLRRVDEHSHVQRVTPRRAASTWSARNVARVAELEAQGRMRPAGRAAFARRSETRTATYTYEQAREAVLPPAFAARFEADEPAWAFFSRQAPSYRRTAIRWILAAKREETRERRLEAVVAASGRGEPPTVFKHAKLRP